VSDYLGHSDPVFILRTYTHFMPASEDGARRAIDSHSRARVSELCQAGRNKRLLGRSEAIIYLSTSYMEISMSSGGEMLYMSPHHHSAGGRTVDERLGYLARPTRESQVMLLEALARLVLETHRHSQSL
jgi:hypothetical protein